MAKQKFYAVKNGREIGIFLSWEECSSQINGFKGAEYKSFATEEEARAYLFEDQIPPPKKKRMTKAQKLELYKAEAERLSDEIEEGRMIAYVDGSFDAETGKYAYGAILIIKGEVITKADFGQRAEAQTARNVAGELLATMFAVKTSASMGIKNLQIFHDYNGISKWYNGEWKAQSFCAKEYISYMEKYRPHMEISFVKVEGHSGVALNEYADLLAKSALGMAEV